MPQVTIASNIVGAEIRYSTDNSDVTEQSTLYSGQFSVEAGTTVKAKAFKSGMNPSAQSTLQSLPKLQTPTISLTRSGSTINITIGNTVEGATYRYKVGSAPTSASDGTAITSTGSVTNSAAVTIYVAGWYTGHYNPSDSASDSVSQYTPTLQTPTLSLSRNGSTVNGTIGNTVSDATYVYKVGSAPSSQSDGTTISGTTFSFTNDNAVTVYVRGYKSGYNASNAVSGSVSQYVKPYPDNWEHYLANMNGRETNMSLEYVAYNGSVYVAVYSSRYAFYSYDLKNWSQVDLHTVEPTVDDTYGIIYSDSYFHIHCKDGIILSSINGISWEKRLNTDAFGTSNVKCMCYGGGKTLIAGNNKVATMQAGNSFSLGTSPAEDMTPRTNGIAYFKGYFYILDSNTDRIFRTSNGSSWQTFNMTDELSLTAQDNVRITGITPSDNLMVVTVSTETSNMVAYTSDGTNWNLSMDTDMNNPYGFSIAYGNGIFLGMSNSRLSLRSPIEIVYSTDGNAWTKINSISDSDGDLAFVGYFDNKFIGTGDSFFTAVGSF